MKEPEMQDFGIQPKDYDLYRGTSKASDEASNLGCLFTLVVLLLVVFAVGFLYGVEVASATFFFGIIPAIFVFMLLSEAILRFQKSRLLKSQQIERIKLYEKAKADYIEAKWEAEKQQREAERARREAQKQRQEAERQRQRIREQYWEAMDGVEFERELGGLFRAIGYGVERTPISGDQGVDLVLRKNGETTVVQCKAHKNGVGPAVARELFGSMVAFGAQRAILACTGGFTKGVYEFVKGKHIHLLDASAIARMTEGVVDKMPEAIRQVEQIRNQPACPRCRRRMVLRRSSLGEFWGCSAYPRCRGTRDAEDY